MSIRLAELAPLDLQLPQFNDCDGGRLTELVSNPLDAGPSLIAADSLFEDVSLMAHEQHVRGYPLLMCPINKKRELPKWHDFQMPFDRDLSGVYDSGMATYKTRQGDFLLFRASPFGYKDCPHSHDAGLGIILHLRGVPILVDSGVGSYTQSKVVRNQFRSAIGKNTILVDGQGPSAAESWFGWTRKTDSQLVSFKRLSDGCSVRGTHSGFSHHVGRHVFLQREVIVLDAGIVVVIDQWDANEGIAVETRFTLNPALTIELERELLRYGEEAFHFRAVSLDGGQNVGCLQDKIPYSADYGHVGETNSIVFRPDASRRAGIATIFSCVGKILELENRRFSFENDDSGIQLSISRQGVRPMRSDVEPASIA